jgi:hypothetical protein
MERTLDDGSTVTSTRPPRVDTRSRAECLEACAECEAACLECADACLSDPDVEALRLCIRLDLDCADICSVTRRLLARVEGGDAKLLRALVEACARACATCGAECHLHANEHEHCRQCMEACRRCAERCGRVLRDLPDTYGETHPPADAVAHAL